MLMGALLPSCTAPAQEEPPEESVDGSSPVDPSTITISTGGTGSTRREGDGECPDLTVEFSSPVPSVMLLVDRSSSMFENQFSASATRWDATKGALVGPASAIERFEDSVNFGFAAYTGTYQGCPLMDVVAPEKSNFQGIAEAYDAASANVGGDTPTGDAVTAVVEQLLAGPAPRYLILATDGEPDTCQRENPQCGQDDSIAAIQAAFAAGVQTFVIGIGSDVGDRHLQDIANAGRGAPVMPLAHNPPDKFVWDCLDQGHVDLSSLQGAYAEVGGDEPYYTPDTPEALGEVIEGLIGGIRSCTFDLAGSVASADAPSGSVTLGGERLVYGSDWTMPDEKTVMLQGEACDSLQTLDGLLDIDFPCGAYVVK